MNSARVEGAIETLLEERGPDKTACPSEVARILAGAGADWRSHMEAVHQAVDAMMASGKVSLSWKGKKLGRRSGAYRIALRRPG